MFIRAFFGALRVRDLVANSKAEAANQQLGIHDISVGWAGITLSTRRSKTDQGLVEVRCG